MGKSGTAIICGVVGFILLFIIVRLEYLIRHQTIGFSLVISIAFAAPMVTAILLKNHRLDFWQRYLYNSMSGVIAALGIITSIVFLQSDFIPSVSTLIFVFVCYIVAGLIISLIPSFFFRSHRNQINTHEDILDDQHDL